MEPLSKIPCGNCGVIFEQTKPWGKYCSSHCNNKAQRKKRQEFLNNYKLEEGCARCGYNFHPAALQFNHIDPTTKGFNIGENKNKSLELILLEIEKCEVLCANCHAIHTQENHYSRLGNTGA
jgi:hypothetical protein